MGLELGKKITILRKSQKRTQSELAEYLCVQPQTVSRWEADGGTPDVSLLPKIALFFGVTLDELFGMTNMEQIEHLVYKYSVLRDEKTFDEVIRSIEMGVESLEMENENINLDDILKRQQLLAWKIHIYIQKSRKAKEDAEKILDELMTEVTQEEHPLYQALRLQKQQFCIQNGEGMAVLKKTKRAWEENRTIDDLYNYLAALMEMDNGASILKLWEEEETQKLVGVVTYQTIPLWEVLFNGALSACALDVFERYYNQFVQELNKMENIQNILFSVKWDKTKLYQRLGKDQEKEAHKAELLQELDQLPLNEYLRDFYRKRISEM